MEIRQAVRSVAKILKTNCSLTHAIEGGRHVAVTACVATLVEHSHVMELIKGDRPPGATNDGQRKPWNPSARLVRWHDRWQETI